MADKDSGIRGFYVSHEIHHNEPRPEILFGVYGIEGGTSGEMAIRWYDIGMMQPIPRLEVYDDGWMVLAGFPDLLSHLAELDDANATPEEIKKVLLACGFKDMTQRERP